jgi:hypothetical protein
MAVFIGSSGWSYDHQAGVFYPKSASSPERLDAYARLFRTVDVKTPSTVGRRTRSSRPGASGCPWASSSQPRRRAA